MTKEQKYQVIWYACDYIWAKDKRPQFESNGKIAEITRVYIDCDDIWVDYISCRKKYNSSLYCYNAKGGKILNAKLISTIYKALDADFVASIREEWGI